MSTAKTQEEREASHWVLNMSSMGAALICAGLFVVGAYVPSPGIMGAATVAGLVGILGRLTFLRETEPERENLSGPTRS